MRALDRVLWAGVFCAAMSSACGPQAEGAGLEVTPSSLTFTATQGGPSPAEQLLHVHRDDTGLVYGTTFEDTGGPRWVYETTFAMIDDSLPDFAHGFAVTTTDLPPGTYTASYVIKIFEPGSYSGTGPYIPGELVERRVIPMTYVVTAP